MPAPEPAGRRVRSTPHETVACRGVVSGPRSGARNPDPRNWLSLAAPAIRDPGLGYAAPGVADEPFRLRPRCAMLRRVSGLGTRSGAPLAPRRSRRDQAEGGTQWPNLR